MKVPKQFEYIDSDILQERIPTFVTILDEFNHHYTDTKYYHVRIEYVSCILGSGYPVAKYETVTEEELAVWLSKIAS